VIPEAAVEAAYLQLPYDAVPFVDIDMMHIILEAAAPHMLSHEREETRLAHVDAVVNAETVDRLQAKLDRVEALIESPFASADKRHYKDDFNRGHVAGYNAAAYLLRAAITDGTSK